MSISWLLCTCWIAARVPLQTWLIYNRDVSFPAGFYWIPVFFMCLYFFAMSLSVRWKNYMTNMLSRCASFQIFCSTHLHHFVYVSIFARKTDTETRVDSCTPNFLMLSCVLFCCSASFLPLWFWMADFIFSAPRGNPPILIGSHIAFTNFLRTLSRSGFNIL